jgi:hypothetical protein
LKFLLKFRAICGFSSADGKVCCSDLWNFVLRLHDSRSITSISGISDDSARINQQLIDERIGSYATHILQVSTSQHQHGNFAQVRSMLLLNQDSGLLLQTLK